MLNIRQIPTQKFHQKLDEFRTNLAEQESIFLIYYSFCSSLFTLENQPHVGCKISLHNDNKRRK